MKAKPLYGELVGKKLQKWVKGSKFRTQKQLAQQLGVSQSNLTRYINGEKEPPGKIVDRLIQLGFPQGAFSEYYARQFELPIPENLTKEDLIKVMFEMQVVMNEWKEMYFKASERAHRHEESNLKSQDVVQRLVIRNENLQKKLDEIKTIRN